MVEILQKEDGVLRKQASEVPVKDIKTPKIKNILKDMQEAMYSQEDGIAIAAPQIGVSLRIFLVSGKVFYLDKEDTENADEESLKKYMNEDLVFINPEIISQSKQKSLTDEGCLSVRWLYGKTKRANKARVRAYNEEGEVFERGGSGILAQIFQHETDHLNGILFIDHAKHLREVLPEEDQENE